MAIRIHVAAALGLSSDEWRTVLDTIGPEGQGSRQFRLGNSVNWQWANASVWQVDGHEIDEALRKLSVPSLRVTTSDAVLWTLTLQAPGKDAFHGCHHFASIGANSDDYEDEPDFTRDEEDELVEVAGIHRYIPELEFLWDDEEEAKLKRVQDADRAARVPSLEYFETYGVTLPADIVEAMRSNPRRAFSIGMRGHGEQIVESLKSYGLQLDEAAVRSLLTSGPLTAVEQDSDIGNLPRFLGLLGITGVFDETPIAEEDAEGEIDEEIEEPRFDPSNHPAGPLMKAFRERLDSYATIELDAGGIEIPAPGILHLFSHLLCSEPPASISVEVPFSDFQPSAVWNRLEELELEGKHNRWTFCWKTPRVALYVVMKGESLDEEPLTAATRELPSGTRWDVAFLVDGLAERVHRYSGTIIDGRWRVERAYPGLTCERLSSVLELVADIFVWEKPIPLQSEQEIAEVRRTYKRAHDEVARIRGPVIRPEPGTRDSVIRTILYERFCNSGPWDMSSAKQLHEEDWGEFEQSLDMDDDEDVDSLDEEEAAEREQLESKLRELEAFRQKQAESKAVPHLGKEVYRGPTGSYWLATLTVLEHLDAESISEFDAEIGRLGFFPLGDFTGDVDQRQSISRCYAGEPRAIALWSHRKSDNMIGWVADTDRSLLSVDFSNGAIEFHTDFADGTSLATVSLDGARSRPELGIYVRCYEDLPLEKLWEKHLDGIRRFESHRGTLPGDHRVLNTPAAFLGRVDGLFAKMLSADAGGS